MFVAVHLSAGRDYYILGHLESTQATVRPLCAPDGCFLAVTHHHHQVNVTVFGGCAPSVRAKQPDLLGLELRHEPLLDRLQQVVIERLHIRVLAGEKCE